MTPFIGVRHVLAEADDENTLALLRHKRRRADDPEIDAVAKIPRQGVPDDFEGAPLVMTLQVLDVLE